MRNATVDEVVSLLDMIDAEAGDGVTLRAMAIEESKIQDRERMHDHDADKAPKPLPPQIGTVDDAMAAALQAANNQQPGPIPFAPVIAPAQLPPSLIASTLGSAAAALAGNGALQILAGLGLRPTIMFPPY